MYWTHVIRSGRGFLIYVMSAGPEANSREWGAKFHKMVFWDEPRPDVAVQSQFWDINLIDDVLLRDSANGTKYIQCDSYATLITVLRGEFGV
jgi:hypothetical protein